MSWPELVSHFTPHSDGGLHDPDGTLIDERVMVLLDRAREEAGVPFHVTSGFRSPARNVDAGGAVDSAHLPDERGQGRAVDGYFEGWPLLEQFLHLMRYPFFAVGVYPYPPPGRDPSTPWIPVVHVDRKDRGMLYNAQTLWIRNAAGRYCYWRSPEFSIELRRLAGADRA